MTNKKNIITVLAIALITSISSVRANNINNLLQLDVKKSSAANTVDVTFYMTENMGNSVVTRKGNNRYVVLLPNVKGSSASTLGMGGVKDLITDVNVKNIDDGIGGYTKITFTTTKPINIKTYVKKTSPLTQAQKDTKAILAQNTKTAVQPAKTESSAVKTAVTKQSSNPQPQAKPFSQTVQPVLKVVSDSKKIISLKQNQPSPKTEPAKSKTVTQPKVEAKPIQNIDNLKTVQKSNTVNSLNNSSDGYVPKMKFDENGKRQIDLEPRVTHEIVRNKPSTNTDTNLFADREENINTPVVDETLPETDFALTQTSETQKSSNHLPLWAIVLGAVSLILGSVYLVYDAAANSSKKNKDRLNSFHSLSSRNSMKKRKREYQDIIEDDTLNWQEKFKKYTQKEKQLNPAKPANDMTYVTDLSATKKAIVMPQQKSVENNLASNIIAEPQIQKPVKEPVIIEAKHVSEIVKKQSVTRNDDLTNKIRAKISQMEHSLAQTPSSNEPEEVFQGVHTEDDAIISKLNDIKLKSFSKPVSLKETLRTALTNDKKQLKAKSYKEGRFVKLKNSPLSVNRRKSAGTDMNTQGLMNMENKYLTNENNGEMKMDNQNENYLLSSLNEYISILDSEDKINTKVNGAVAQSISKVRPSGVKSQSGISNPISRASNPLKSANNSQNLNGFVVKSGYNINNEKGFYIVNKDGVSALVGRVKDDIFILKKFDHIIDKPVQVRQDYGTVYIVKAGGFKCLVDVANDKMGTLIEI